MAARRAIPLLVVLAAAAAPATPAGAAVKRGTFDGATSQGDPIGFKVDRRSRVYGFHFSAVTLTCTDGDSVDTPARTATPRSERFRIVRNRFGISARNPTTGFAWSARGRFRSRGRQATGTLTLSQTFDEDNRQDPDGSIRCETGPLPWSARRR